MKNPILAVDIIIEQKGKIILIERKNEPFGIALPGGKVDIGETVESAAIREAKEETNLDIKLKRILGVYSDPKRDPRGHNVSVVFIAEGEGTTKAGSDAKAIIEIDRFSIPKELQFDHKKIITDYYNLHDANNFEHLVSLCEKLRSPEGCPWDREQTIESLVKDFFGEAEELKEAIANNDTDNLREEIGDVCFTLALIMEIAKENKLFTPKEVFAEVAEKITTRHSWVFGSDKVNNIEEALVLWKINKAKHKEEMAKRNGNKNKN
jgi:ADP-ribose pyrophosphatase YjhB (NUDIX family)